jgi:hypothetical protein
MNELTHDTQDFERQDPLIWAQHPEQPRNNKSTQRPHSQKRSLSSLHGASEDRDRTQFDVSPPTEIDITSEAESLAKLLVALTLNSTVEDALTTFFSFLPEQERTVRTALVLTQMGEVLPADVNVKLKRTRSLFACRPHGGGAGEFSFSRSLVSMGILVLSGIAFVLMVIGAFTSFRHIAANFHPLEVGTVSRQVLRNMFFMVCTCAEHSR